MRIFAQSRSPDKAHNGDLAHRMASSRRSDRTDADISAGGARRPHYDFSRTPIFPRTGDLTADPLVDAGEQEAERASQQVMSAGPPSRNAMNLRSRSGGETAPEPSVVRDLIPGGKPLDPPIRSFMESRLGFDFGRVRVHCDRSAEEAASRLSARAFTLGPHIAFAAGEYAPETQEGLRLVAHELTHVAQQARDHSLVLRRKPALQGTSKESFNDKDAAKIDKAIKESPVAKYFPADKLQTLAGHVELLDPEVFKSKYEKYQKKHGGPKDVTGVAGFTEREEKPPIKLRTSSSKYRASNREAAVHETIHLSSSKMFQNSFGHNFNEGVTEYFTEMVFDEPLEAYRDELKLAHGLIDAVGVVKVADAFFKGDMDLLLKMILPALEKAGKTLDWRKASNKEPPDWETATQLLKAALQSASKASSAAPAQPAHPSESPQKSP